MDNKIFKDSMLALTNQSNLSLTGVEKVIEVSEKQLVLEVAGTMLMIDGNNMSVQKLDVENGLLEIKGFINALKYQNKKEKINIIKRIFK